jgi:predicted esterase
MGVKFTAQAAPGAVIAIAGDLGTDNRVLGTGALRTPDVAVGTWLYGNPGTIYYPPGITTVKTIYFDTSKDYLGPSTVNAYVTVNDGSSYNTYHVTIKIGDSRPTIDLFTIAPAPFEAVLDGNGPSKVRATIKVPYAYYKPKNIQAGDKFPLVLALHGGSTRQTDIKGILQRYDMATIWAADSEKDPSKRAYVLVPQASTNANSGPPLNGTTAWASGPSGAHACLEGAFKLLDQFIADNPNIDTNRIYVTGMSLGGGGSIASIVNYPNKIAAAIIICPAGSISNTVAAALKAQYDMPMRWIHALEDPTVDVKNTVDSIAALNAAKFTDVAVEYPPAGTYFYEAAHYSWVAVYRSQQYRTWLFNQHK